MSIKRALPKVIATVLLGVVFAFFAADADKLMLAKMNSMTDREFVESQRQTFHKSTIHHIAIWAVVGGVYVASVEAIAWVIGFCFPRSWRPNKAPEPTAGSAGGRGTL